MEANILTDDCTGYDDDLLMLINSNLLPMETFELEQQQQGNQMQIDHSPSHISPEAASALGGMEWQSVNNSGSPADTSSFLEHSLVKCTLKSFVFYPILVLRLSASLGSTRFK